MNLEHLRYFLVLSRCEHYRQAAEELCISQPGLSHAISALEEELGVPLFRKKGRNIVLNQYGQILRQDAEKIIAMVDKTTESFSNITSGGGIIHIAGVTRMAGLLLPQLVRHFKDQSDTDGDFHFYTDMTPQVVQGVRDGRYNIGFCFKQDWKDDLEVVPFQKQEMVVIVKPDHPLAGRESVTLHETLEYPQIVFSNKSAIKESMDEFWSNIEEKPIVSYEIEQDSLITEMIYYDFGIAVLPKFPNIEKQGLVAIPISDPQWNNTFYMIRRKDAFRSPLEKEFFGFCLERRDL
ncbi:MAG: LysR family transcriptional regulator [Lachnospiraceae bacterium]|nr:LysR family transcriptional regulator [Lachnospiraceae bacterium]